MHSSQTRECTHSFVLKFSNFQMDFSFVPRKSSGSAVLPVLQPHAGPCCWVQMAARETGFGAVEAYMHQGKLLALDLVVRLLENPLQVPPAQTPQAHGRVCAAPCARPPPPPPLPQISGSCTCVQGAGGGGSLMNVV